MRHGENIEEGGVIRLWCILSHDDGELISSLNRQHRFLRMSRIPLELMPKWAKLFPGVVYCMCESYGEYNGCLGDALSDHPEFNVQEASAELRRRHPKWTEQRIARVIQELELKDRRSRAQQRRTDRPCAMMVDVLKTLAASGSVVLILDDGGTITEALGGTAERADNARMPHVAMTHHIRRETLQCDDLLSIAYWVPLQIE